MGRQNQCQECGDWGHNRRGCPAIKAAHARVEAMAKKYGVTIPGKETQKNKPSRLMVDKFAFNHIAQGKDWDRLILMGINPTKTQCLIKEHKQQIGRPHYEQQCYFMEKEDFIAHLNSGDYAPFLRQQGGVTSENDDYIVSSSISFYQLIALPFVKPISEW